jgi:hypothetical protein
MSGRGDVTCPANPDRVIATGCSHLKASPVHHLKCALGYINDDNPAAARLEIHEAIREIESEDVEWHMSTNDKTAATKTSAPSANK